MERNYKGWIIERIEGNGSGNYHYNMRPVGSECWTDAADLLREAKALINKYNATAKE
tara:strand:+ start:340 stop:510 length:171 start_codon:yes stop_codon:yes gene_type:complete